MSVATVERGPIAATAGEQPDLDRLERLFAAEGNRGAKLVGPRGEEIDVPESVYRILRQVIRALAHEQAVTVVPFHKRLTTQEAANLLGVSRPYLIGLLDRGEIPFTRTGSHRRIRFDDLMAYRKERDEKRRDGLARLTRLSQEAGLYADQ